jgi:hypothetical protein
VLAAAGCSSASASPSNADAESRPSDAHAAGSSAISTRPVVPSASTSSSARESASLDGTDGGSGDGAVVPPGDASDAGDAGNACESSGAPGVCITTSACAAWSDHTAFPGQCPGPADIQCCILTPSTADNPPTPPGYVLMPQAEVTSAMTSWAVMILDEPVTYPMFSTAMMEFGSLDVLARVEWHPPDFQNSVVHRGVTLYVPD